MYKFLVWKPEGKRPRVAGRMISKWILKKCVRMWTEYRDQMRAVMNILMNDRIPKWEKFLDLLSDC
jgi:hypothetical protein